MLSHVADFDFKWHVNYVYTDDSAPVLPAGTVIHITAWHDNTAEGRGNPILRSGSAGVSAATTRCITPT